MTDTATRPPAPQPGLRERSKQDKQRRILEAAREVFIEHGYDAATTREIASRAGVSIGTIFVYAKDKRDLLLQIVNDEVDTVTATSRALAEQPGNLLARLLAYFEVRYRYWAREPRLARPALRETFDFMDPGDPQGTETQRFYSRRPMMLEHLEQIVRSAQASGEVLDDPPAEEIASLIFSLYLIEVRRWLSHPKPSLAAGMERLGRVLGLFMRGILTGAAPAPAAVTHEGAAPRTAPAQREPTAAKATRRPAR